MVEKVMQCLQIPNKGLAAKIATKQKQLNSIRGRDGKLEKEIGELFRQAQNLRQQQKH